MENIEKNVKEFNGLVISGDTLKAMELFYAEKVSMQENEEPPRRGKDICMAHEMKNLGRVKEFKGVLISQAINPLENIVLSEWEYYFTTKNEKKLKLCEVSVQHWENGQVVKEKFYYKEVLQIM